MLQRRGTVRSTLCDATLRSASLSFSQGGALTAPSLCAHPYPPQTVRILSDSFIAFFVRQSSPAAEGEHRCARLSQAASTTTTSTHAMLPGTSCCVSCVLYRLPSVMLAAGTACWPAAAQLLQVNCVSIGAVSPQLLHRKSCFTEEQMQHSCYCHRTTRSCPNLCCETGRAAVMVTAHQPAHASL